MVLGTASFAATLALWPRFDAAQGPETSRAVPASTRPPGFWRLVLCYGAFGFGYIIPATFLPVMAKEALADPRHFAWAWPAFGAAAAVSTLLAGRMSRRLGPRRLWIAASLVMAIGVAVPLEVPGLAGIIAAAIGVGGTFMVITMAGMEEARRVAGAQARALMAGMTSAFALGQVAGPLAASYVLGSERGFAAALLAASALLILSAIALAMPSKGIP